MSDEVVGHDQEIVQPEVKEEISVHAEETTPKPDAPTQETGGEEKDPHPLSPDGDRFKQVWARGKEAERERDHYRAESQKEREERIRLEERLAALEASKQTQPKLTWAHYQAAIDNNQISQADAMARWADQIQKEAEERAVKSVEEKLANTSKQATVLSEIDRYKNAIPELNQYGTEARRKVEQEYAYLVDRGAPKSLATEVAALRAAYGSVETVERSIAAKKTVTKEPFMETHSSTRKPQNNTNDPIKNLDENKRKYYERQIEKGRYADWKEVAEELKFQAPSMRYSRG